MLHSSISSTDTSDLIVLHRAGYRLSSKRERVGLSTANASKYFSSAPPKFTAQGQMMDPTGNTFHICKGEQQRGIGRQRLSIRYG